MYLAVISDFMALEDDKHCSECALIPVTTAWYHFTLYVFFWLAEVQMIFFYKRSQAKVHYQPDSQ